VWRPDEQRALLFARSDSRRLLALWAEHGGAPG
jgi:hypothetical protein